MTTNLIFQLIITLVTNVANSDNAHQENAWEQHGDMISFSPVTVPATERYNTTNIERVATIKFTYEGQDKQLDVERKLISSVTRVMKLTQEWEQGELRTN